MVYSYRNFPFGETVTGKWSGSLSGSRPQMAWVLNSKFGISYIGRATSGNAAKSKKNPARDRKYAGQTA